MRIFVEATWASVRLVTSRRLVAEGTKCGGHTHLAASFFDVKTDPLESVVEYRAVAEAPVMASAKNAVIASVRVI